MIFVYFIKIRIKSTRYFVEKEYCITHELRKPFRLGETYLDTIRESYEILEVQNSTHAYHFEEHSSKIKIIPKECDGESKIEVVENDLIFESCKFFKYTFEGLASEKILYGLENIKDEILDIFNRKTNDTILLCGPEGSGKQSLLKNLEIELESWHFFWMSDKDILADDRYVSLNVAKMARTRNPTVVCYEGKLADSGDVKIDIVHHSINELLRKKVAPFFLVRFNHENEICWGAYVIEVPELSLENKQDLLSNFFPGFGNSELEKAAKLFNNFSAGKMIDFIDYLTIKYPDCDVERLESCLRDLESSSTQSNLTTFDVRKNRTRLADFGGYDEVKDLLTEFVIDLFKGKKKPMEGLLLHGPSGCGKSMLVQCVATECDVPIFEINPQDIFRSRVGESEQELKKIFAEAIYSSPSIIYIDKIETMFSDDSSVAGRLLSEMCKFMDKLNDQGDKQVLFIAETDQIDKLDPQLIRPLRIGFQVEIGLPDQNSIESIMKVTLSRANVEIDDEVIDKIPDLAKYFRNKPGVYIADFLKRVTNSCKKRGEIVSMKLINDSLIDSSLVSNLMDLNVA